MSVFFDDDDDMELYEIECLREDAFYEEQTSYEREENYLPKDNDIDWEFCVEHQMFFDDCECNFEI